LLEYITQIQGKLNPAPAIEYGLITENLPGFSITIERERVVAIPHSKILAEEETVALEQLQQQISPILSVLGAQEGRTIMLEITDVNYPNLKRLSTAILVTYSISAHVPRREDIQRKIRIAVNDPVYRDLLDFYTEALAAANPRPVGFKMVERLEKKFGDRQKACAALGLVKHDLNLITADQSRFKGDRHADYGVGDIPVRLNQVERGKVFELLKRIMDKYEKLYS